MKTRSIGSEGHFRILNGNDAVSVDIDNWEYVNIGGNLTVHGDLMYYGSLINLSDVRLKKNVIDMDTFMCSKNQLSEIFRYLR